MHRRIQQPGLLAQGKGTRTISQILMEEMMAVVMIIGMAFGLILQIGTPGSRALPRTSVSQKHWYCSKFSLVPLVWSLRPHCPPLAAIRLQLIAPGSDIGASPCQESRGHREEERLGIQQSRDERERQILKRLWQWLPEDEGNDHARLQWRSSRRRSRKEAWKALLNTPCLWSRKTGTHARILVWLALHRWQAVRATKVTAAWKGLTLPAMWRKKLLPSPPEEPRDIKRRE